MRQRWHYPTRRHQAADSGATSTGGGGGGGRRPAGSRRLTPRRAAQCNAECVPVKTMTSHRKLISVSVDLYPRVYPMYTAIAPKKMPGRLDQLFHHSAM